MNIIENKKNIKIILILLNFSLLLFTTPKGTMINIDIIRMRNPNIPELLKNIVLIKFEIIKEYTPYLVPNTSVDKYIGISETSSFRKGNTGKIDNLQINPRITETDVNIQL